MAASLLRGKLKVAHMPTWETQGTHRFYREGDLVFFECHGLFGLDDMNRLLSICDDLEREYGYVLSIYDTIDGMNMSADARRVVGERNRSHDVPSAAAIIGASFAIRTVAMLLNNAARLIGKNISPAHFFQTQEEAMTWIAAQREACRRAAAQRRHQ